MSALHWRAFKVLHLVCKTGFAGADHGTLHNADRLMSMLAMCTHLTIVLNSRQKRGEQRRCYSLRVEQGWVQHVTAHSKTAGSDAARLAFLMASIRAMCFMTYHEPAELLSLHRAREPRACGLRVTLSLNA